MFTTEKNLWTFNSPNECINIDEVENPLFEIDRHMARKKYTIHIIWEEAK